jgi:hypothetical protein
MQFLQMIVKHMVLLNSKRRFDGFVKIEEKAFESMLESLPLHGGLLHNACYTKIVTVQLVTTIRDSVSMVTLCDLSLFYFSSHICAR